MTLTAPRLALESPYLPEQQAHAMRSMQRAARMPQTLEGLIAWYATAWELEMPPKLHVHSVWFGRPEQGMPSEHVGGSVLGSPGFLEEARRLVEESDHATDRDGYYVRPLRSALRRIATGGPRRHPMPHTSDGLIELARGGYDWQALTRRRLFWSEEIGYLYWAAALALTWQLYRDKVRG